MKSYIPITFVFLGFAGYLLSGGRDFVPEVRPQQAEAVAAQDLLPAPAELVTRAETELTLASLTDLPVIAPVAETLAQDAQVLQPGEPQADPVEIAAAPVADLRTVNGDRVNMREGPGTDFGVVEKLARGTEVEVIETGPDGWVRLRVVQSGLEGWIAARLLTDANI